MSDVRDRRGWHLDRGISVTNILATASVVVAGVMYLGEQDTRISNLELNVQHLQQTALADQDRTEKKFDELKTDLRVINAKLDRLIEGRVNGN